MKQTVSANIGSQQFVIDEDAYGVLRSYLNDIQGRLLDGDVETMSDIEARIAEIFSEKLGSSSMRVVTIETVNSIMIQMGAPSDFGDRHNSTNDDQNSTKSRASDNKSGNNANKLYRLRSDRAIAGICGGIARFFNINPTLVRLLTLLLICFGGISIWVYVILWIVIPEEPLITSNNYNKNR